jgi:hypothetical protein
MFLIFTFEIDRDEFITQFRILEQDESLRQQERNKPYLYHYRDDDYIIRSNMYPFIGTDDFKRIAIGLRGCERKDDNIDDNIYYTDRLSKNLWRIPHVVQGFTRWAKLINKTLYYNGVTNLFYIE